MEIKNNFIVGNSQQVIHNQHVYNGYHSLKEIVEE